ncbi:MAG TPA: DUF5985 family protein [Polyangiales bacterium]
MAELIYFGCFLASVLCATLLVRSYRASRTPLLLWSSLCFVGLALNNALLFLDLTGILEPDLSIYRGAIGLASLLVLLYGLIWHTR